MGKEFFVKKGFNVEIKETDESTHFLVWQMVSDDPDSNVDTIFITSEKNGVLSRTFAYHPTNGTGKPK